MTKKDIRKVEEVVEKVLHEMLEEYDEGYDEGYNVDDDETTIPTRIIDEMEDYMGEPITFMGIS
tara:strand:- start:204 stop:395 length:192 start_codon:yes stop_codon:yes gene_type:complete